MVRIETQLATLIDELKVLRSDVRQVKDDLTAERQRLSRLQDRGIGLLLGVGLGGGAMGAGLTRLFERLFH